MKKRSKAILAFARIAMVVAIVLFISVNSRTAVYATDILGTEETTTAANASDNFTIGISAGNGSDLASVLQIVLVLTVIALAPSILIMLTSFANNHSNAFYKNGAGYTVDTAEPGAYRFITFSYFFHNGAYIYNGI